MAVGWTRCLLRATYTLVSRIESEPRGSTRTPEESARRGGIGHQASVGTPGLSPWPEAQALTRALQVATACRALLAMGLRLGGGARGPADACLSPKEQSRETPGGRAHRNQKSEATQGLWGTAEQRTAGACSQNGHALTVQEHML